ELAALVIAHARSAAPWDVLDLGCGTGLMGAQLAAHTRRLVGVDLSRKMLQQAGKRGIYQALECRDIAEVLEAAEPGSYDIVAAADVFVYMGKLDALVARLKTVLRPTGMFAFSVEAVEAAATDGAGYRLAAT